MVKPEDVWVIRNKGMPGQSGKRGHLYLRFQVEFPDQLAADKASDADAKAQLSQLLGQSPTSETQVGGGRGGGLLGRMFSRPGATETREAASAQRASRLEQERVARAETHFNSAESRR